MQVPSLTSTEISCEAMHGAEAAVCALALAVTAGVGEPCPHHPCRGTEGAGLGTLGEEVEGRGRPPLIAGSCASQGIRVSASAYIGGLCVLGQGYSG